MLIFNTGLIINRIINILTFNKYYHVHKNYKYQNNLEKGL